MSTTPLKFAYVLSVMSNDHPGIVSGVSSALERFGGNIDSCSQTVLDGFFTLIMTVSLPMEIPSQELVDKLRSSEELGPDYQILVRRIDEKLKREQISRNTTSSETFVITATGKDRPGIVREFSRHLAGHDININDLFGHRSGDDFVLIGQLQVPLSVDTGNLQEDLRDMGRDLGFTVSLQHNNIFVATNRIQLD